MSELEPEEKYSTEIDFHNEENYFEDEYATDGESVPELKLVAIDQTVTSKITRKLSDSKYEDYKSESTAPHIDKHTVIGPAYQQDLERSQWLTNVLEKLKERWPSSFDNVGCLETAISIMNGDKQYKYILSVTNLMHERGKKRVVEITENGKCIEHSKAGKEIPIQVNTVIASIARENDKGVAGVLIEKLDVDTQCVKKNAKYNHFEGCRDYQQYKEIDFTGPIDKDGKPIETPTERLDQSDLYKLLENAHSDGDEYIEQN